MVQPPVATARVYEMGPSVGVSVERTDGVTPAASASERFDAFYAAARDRLTLQVAALTGDVTEAADHVQEAFVRAWARWDRVESLDDPEGWVRRVARNLAVSRWRRARRVVLRASVPEVVVEWDDEERELLAALRTLPGSSASPSSCTTSSVSRSRRSPPTSAPPRAP